MTKIVYEIVEHDGGWAFKLGDTISETFKNHDAAYAAARRWRWNRCGRDRRSASRGRIRRAAGTTKSRRATTDRKSRFKTTPDRCVLSVRIEERRNAGFSQMGGEGG